MEQRAQATSLSAAGVELGAKAASDKSDSTELDLKQVVLCLRALEQRVEALEARSDGHTPLLPRREPSPVLPARPDAVARRPGDTARAIPVVGTIFLALAGAYLLRASAEYKLVPLRAGIAAGMVYATAWLFLAVRGDANERFVGIVRSVTSALILVPLMWEATVRLGAIGSATAASVLALFSLLGLILSRRHQPAIPATIAVVVGTLTTAVLLMATHDAAPFALAVLAIAAVIEAHVCLGYRAGARWTVAVIADLAVLFLASIASRAGGVSEGYAPISAPIALAAQIVLPTIYLASASVKSLWRSTNLAVLEAIQTGVALLLGFTGILQLAHGPTVTAIVCGFAVLCGALFYAVSFGFFQCAARNFYMYSSLALLCVVFGSLLQFSDLALALILSACSLLLLLVNSQLHHLALLYHSAAYLLLAAAVSGLGLWSTARLLGTGVGWVPLTPAAWITALATLLAYIWMCRIVCSYSSSSAQPLPVLAVAASAAWTLAGISEGALSQVAGMLGSFRTALPIFVLTSAAMLLALGGRKWNRREQIWLVYPLMALAALKLLVQDLPRGQTLSLFASLFLYGGGLVLLPRILQAQRQVSRQQK